jgi:predicted transcriptional regulator
LVIQWALIKDVLRLKLELKHSHQHIAASLGITKGVVCYRRHRSAQIWRSRLTHEGITMRKATITFRVDGGLKEEFSSAAKTRDRTGAQLLRDFMRDFVKQQQEATEHDSWFRREVQIGLDAANAGDVVSADEEEAQAVAWRAETRRKLAGTHS